MHLLFTEEQEADRDDGFVSLDSIREDANTRLLMTRIADAEAERERRNPSGGRRPVRTEAMPEQKIYSGTVLRPAGSAER